MRSAHCAAFSCRRDLLFIGSLVSHFAGDAVWWFGGGTALVIAILVGREGFNAVKNARRRVFNGCGCCDQNSGWYIRYLRKRRESMQRKGGKEMENIATNE